MRYQGQSSYGLLQLGGLSCSSRSTLNIELWAKIDALGYHREEKTFHQLCLVEQVLQPLQENKKRQLN